MIDGSKPIPNFQKFTDDMSLSVFRDNVNHPSHYTGGDIECIDAINASMSKDEFLGYCKGNALKYIWRYKDKGYREDIKKAIWYLNKMLDDLA